MRLGRIGGRASGGERFWEVDALRGVAILMMISFHTLFDLNYFGLTDFALYSGTLGIFAYSIGTIFLLLVGVSLTISYDRSGARMNTMALRVKFLRRGAFIFGLGLLITTVTYALIGPGFVIFGVLHCIGLSIVLAYPLLRFRWLSLAAGSAFVLAGMALSSATFDFPWLLWLGLKPVGFVTLDYFPLLPWLGVVLIGVFIGRSLYRGHERGFTIKDRSSLGATRGVVFLGRHSLPIYLGHQVIIVGLIAGLLMLP
jgi:uncharacterized membrane protein